MKPLTEVMKTDFVQTVTRLEALKKKKEQDSLEYRTLLNKLTRICREYDLEPEQAKEILKGF